MHCPRPEDPEGGRSERASRTTSRDSRERDRRKDSWCHPDTTANASGCNTGQAGEEKTP